MWAANARRSWSSAASLPPEPFPPRLWPVRKAAMLSIHDSLTRETRPFEPLVPGKVSIYVCGQTVYDAAHLGHARKEVGFDIVIRWLEASGYEVTYVRNITDIDDKIIDRAAANGETIGALTGRMIQRMNVDFAALGLRIP